jgi:phage recombination protein Bet
MTTETKHEKHDRLTQEIRGKRCRQCKTLPTVAHINGDLVIRCACYPKAPSLEKPNYVGERASDMLNQSLATLQSQGQIEKLTTETIQHYICPMATQKEAYIFLMMCQGLDINPFVNEAYLIKYAQNAKAAFVVGVQAYIKWASRNVDYAGYESGIVVTNKQGETEYRDGALVFPGDALIGGWCTVHRHTWKVSPRRTVSLQEYNKHQSLWNEKPATMIEKVAICQAHRRAFPEDVGRRHTEVREYAKAESIEVVEGDPEVADSSYQQVPLGE